MEEKQIYNANAGYREVASLLEVKIDAEKKRGDMYRKRALALRRQASVYRRTSRASKVVAIQTVVAFTDAIISLQRKAAVWRSLFWIAFCSFLIAAWGLVSYAVR